MPDKLRELILFRHAKSDWSDPNLADIDRPLAERGRRNAKKMADWLLQQDLMADLIVCSPAKRAQQTLRRLCKDRDCHIETVDSLYMADVPTMLSILARLDTGYKRVMLIGHNPGMEELIAFLQGEPVSRTPEIKLFPTAAIAQFIMPASWDQLEPGDGKLVGITRPKDI